MSYQDKVDNFKEAVSDLFIATNDPNNPVCGAGQVKAQELINAVNGAKQIADTFPSTYCKVPAAITTSVKPDYDAYNDPLIVNVGDQVSGKRQQIIVWVGKAEDNEIPGFEDYPQLTKVAEAAYYDKAGVIQVYEWNNDDWQAPEQLVFKILRGGGNSTPPYGFAGAAISRSIDVGESWAREDTNSGYSKNATLPAGSTGREVVACIHEGHLVYTGNAEVLASLPLTRSNSDRSGHLLLLSGTAAADAFTAECRKFDNDPWVERFFLVMGGSN